VQFVITIHSGQAAPPDAIDLLARRLGARQDEASFAQVGREIDVTWGESEGSVATRHERVEPERRKILEMVRDVCDRAAELQSDWFAIRPKR
jgi:hypothetical protein